MLADVSKRSLRQQLAAFIAVGGVAAVVDFGLLTLLMWAGLGHTPAKALSWVAGTVTAYLLNSRFTFMAEANRRSFALVMVLYVTTFVVQVGLFALLFPLAEPWLAGWTPLVCYVIAQAVATTINFIVQRVAIFRE